MLLLFPVSIGRYSDDSFKLLDKIIRIREANLICYSIHCLRSGGEKAFALVDAIIEQVRIRSNSDLLFKDTNKMIFG